MLELLKAQLRSDEGVVIRPYKDSEGIWTCGVGWNMEDMPMCRKAMDEQLDYQARLAIEDARALFHNFNYLPPIIQSALANMAYNLGRSRLSGFIKMRKAIENNNFELAADEALDSKWATQVGARAERIASILRNYNQP